MAPNQPKTGLFVGLNKGHVVTKKELAPRPCDRKGKTSKRVHFVRSLVREVAGWVCSIRKEDYRASESRQGQASS